MHVTKSQVFLYEYMWRLLEAVGDDFWRKFDPYYLDKTDTGNQAMAGELVYDHVRHDYLRVFFKFSQYEDNLILHEYSVLVRLHELIGDTVPHLVHLFGVRDFKSFIPPSKGIYEAPPSSYQSPDSKSTEDFVYRKMLILENIPALDAIEWFIERQEISIVVALIQQVLMMIRILRHHRATHYDLHCGNILVRQCPDNLVLVYEDEKTEFVVPTFGYLCVLIDFGFAYVEGSSAQVLYPNMFHANKGYLCDRYHPYVDYARFLDSVAYHLTRGPNPGQKKSLKRLIQRALKQTGIEDFQARLSTNPVKYLERQIFDRRKGPPLLTLFTRIDWLSALQLLIPTPLTAPGEEVKVSREPFIRFAHEWKKVEERLVYDDLNLYLFKFLVRLVQAAGPSEIHHAAIKSAFLNEFTRLVNSYIPPFHWENLLSSLWNMAEQVRIHWAHGVEICAADMLKLYESAPFSAESCDDYFWDLFAPYHPSPPAGAEYLTIPLASGK